MPEGTILSKEEIRDIKREGVKTGKRSAQRLQMWSEEADYWKEETDGINLSI